MGLEDMRAKEKERAAKAAVHRRNAYERLRADPVRYEAYMKAKQERKEAKKQKAKEEEC
jgi:hypothetical protein